MRRLLHYFAELLYRAADALGTATFIRERHPEPPTIQVADALISVIDDLAAYTDLPIEVVRRAVLRRRGISFRSEWFATPRALREDHWYYLSSKAYLFANATHFADGQLAAGIADRLPPDARILDFGGGTGEMTLQLAAHGFRVTFTELSALQRDFMRFRVHRHGLGDIIDVLDPWAPPCRDLDAVVALDVLEHLPDARTVIETRLLPALNERGALIENSPFHADASNPMHHTDYGMDEHLAGRGLAASGMIGAARVWERAGVASVG